MAPCRSIEGIPALTGARRILVVEDSEIFRRPLQRTLELAGYEVSVVSTAERALGALRRGEADLVLTDVGLPGMDGLELLRQIKREYPPLPVIVISAQRTLGAADGPAALGAEHYLVKPFEPADLLEAVRGAIARREPAQAMSTGPLGTTPRRPA